MNKLAFQVGMMQKLGISAPTQGLLTGKNRYEHWYNKLMHPIDNYKTNQAIQTHNEFMPYVKGGLGILGAGAGLYGLYKLLQPRTVEMPEAPAAPTSAPRPVPQGRSLRSNNQQAEQQLLTS